MSCDECREKLVEYIEGLLTDQETQQFKSHLGQCSLCRTELDQLTALGQRLTSDAKNRQSADVENRVVNRIICEQNRQLKQAAGIDRQLQIWRIIMKSKITKFAAAAIVLIAAILSLTLFQSVTPAYAIEQTVQACHSIRFLHVRKIVPGHEEPVMVWAEFFEDGQPKSIRLNIPDWDSGGDGEKQVIWKDNVAQIWFKKKNGFLRVREQKLADDILKAAKEYDPKTFLQNLMHKTEAGECQLQIEQPSDKAQHIIVTVIALPDKEKKLVLSVDQATGLPLTLETYQLNDGEYVLENTGEFYDYNQPIDPNMFVFDNLPADVMAVDQVANAVGLEQGQMTNDEVAIEVVRRFWQAIIDGDYNTASQMYDGIPSEKLRKAFEAKFKDKNIKIVSVGPVKPHPNPKTRGVIVPCILEIEAEGQTAQFPLDRIGVRQVYNQPGRWTIFGGI